MAEAVVRPAQLEDADEIARVHVDTWKVAYRGQIPDDYLDALSVERRKRVWRELLRARDRDETNWVAERDGCVVGFSGAGPTRDEDADAQTGEVFAIYVTAEHWGTGAGPLLMVATTDWLRARFDAATLWVLDSNERARRFYERCGWRADGATKDDDRGSFVLHEVRYRIDF